MVRLSKETGGRAKTAAWYRVPRAAHFLIITSDSPQLFNQTRHLESDDMRGTCKHKTARSNTRTINNYYIVGVQLTVHLIINLTIIF